MKRAVRSRVCGSIAVCALASFAPAANAQLVATRPVTAQDRAENIAVNAAVGAAIGGVKALITRKPVMRGLLRGTAGGATTGAAKQLAAQRFTGAGLFGRIVNSGGVALIASASADTLTALLPLGPLAFELVPSSHDRLRTRVNVWTSVIAGLSLVDSRARFDLSASVGTGAFVFEVVDEGMPWGSGEAGFAHPGVIFLNRLLADRSEDRDLTLAHESVHILQWDAYHTLITRPVERAIIARLPGFRALNSRVELHVLAPLSVWAVASRIENERRPWEREAYALTGELITGAPNR